MLTASQLATALRSFAADIEDLEDDAANLQISLRRVEMATDDLATVINEVKESVTEAIEGEENEADEDEEEEDEEE